MRKITLENWKAISRDGKEVEESLIQLISALLSNKRPEEMPRGMEKFRLFSRLHKIFENAEKTKEMLLEEADYKFIKETIEKDIPSIWGTNPSISSAIESFMNAKEE